MSVPDGTQMRIRFSSQQNLLSTDDRANSSTLVRSLLFYEGEHTSMEGATEVWDRAKVEKVFAATQQYMSQRRVKLFASSDDHLNLSEVYAVSVLESIEQAEITEADLAQPGLTDLVGKLGIFGYWNFTTTEGRSAYEAGKYREVSVGIDTEGTLGVPYAIYHTAIVGIPALAGATLYAAPLTIAEQMQGDVIKRAINGLWDLFDAFTSVVMNAKEAELVNELPQGQTFNSLADRAISDFAAELRSRFQISSPPPSVPSFSATLPNPMTTEKDKPVDGVDFAAQLAKMQADQNRMFSLTRRFSAAVQQRSTLKERALELKAKGQMTQTAIDELFPPDADLVIAEDADLDTTEATVAAAEAKLEKDVGIVEYAAKYVAPVKQGLPVELPEVPAPTDAQTETVNNFFKAYTPKRSF